MKRAKGYMECERRFMDEKELAAMLSVSRMTIRIWRHKRKGPPSVKIGERLIRYLLSDVLDWINKNNDCGVTSRKRD